MRSIFDLIFFGIYFHILLYLVDLLSQQDGRKKGGERKEAGRQVCWVAAQHRRRRGGGGFFGVGAEGGGVSEFPDTAAGGQTVTWTNARWWWRRSHAPVRQYADTHFFLRWALHWSRFNVVCSPLKITNHRATNNCVGSCIPGQSLWTGRGWGVQLSVLRSQ